jgi:membrane-bound serine protease (ClpP class)
MARPMPRAVPSGRIVSLPFVAAILLAPLAWSGPANTQDDVPSVVVAKVDGSMDRTVVAYLIDTLEDAERAGSTVVLQLDSAGTLDEDAIALARRIHEASVPVVVWVGPAPAKAQGGALLLLYAASAGAVAPGAGIGPLAPLDLAGAPETPADEVRALASTWALERGRPAPGFAEEPIPAGPAIDRHIASVVAASIPELLSALDETTVVTREGDVTLHTRIARAEGEDPVNVRFVDLGPVNRVLHAAASPTWIYVLVVLGLAALAFEITQPGFGFAGFSGIGMLALAAYGLTVVPFSWVGLLLLVGGLGLMTLDAMVRRLGVLTGCGLAGFAVGSVLVFSGVAEQIDVSIWLIGSFAVAALLYWGFGLTVAVRSRERITSTQKGLVGLVGETRGALRPEGPVFVKGALWRGKSTDGSIPAGTRVRVRGVDGLVLRVQAEPEPEPPSGDPGAETTPPERDAGTSGS